MDGRGDRSTANSSTGTQWDIENCDRD